MAVARPESPQQDGRDGGDHQAGQKEEPWEERERWQGGDGLVVVEVAVHPCDQVTHVLVDRGPLAVERAGTCVGRVVLFGRDGALGDHLVAKCDGLAVGGVDEVQIAGKRVDLGRGHVGLELVDHVAALGRPVEHLEDRGGDCEAYSDHQRGDRGLSLDSC